MGAEWKVTSEVRYELSEILRGPWRREPLTDKARALTRALVVEAESRLEAEVPRGGVWWKPMVQCRTERKVKRLRGARPRGELAVGSEAQYPSGGVRKGDGVGTRFRVLTRGDLSASARAVAAAAAMGREESDGREVPAGRRKATVTGPRVGEGRRPRPVTWQANWGCSLRQPKPRKGPAAWRRRAKPLEREDRCRSQEAPLRVDCQR